MKTTLEATWMLLSVASGVVVATCPLWLKRGPQELGASPTWDPQIDTITAMAVPAGLAVTLLQILVGSIVRSVLTWFFTRNKGS